MLVNLADYKLDFHKCNPELSLVEDIKKTPSKIMWGIAFINDPKSKFFNLPKKDKENLIKKEYIKDETIDFNKYQKVTDMYIKLCTTSAQRHLIEWNNKMDEKSEYVRTLEYGSETWKQIDDMLSSNTKLYAELERITTSLAIEEAEGAVKGGQSKSMLESQTLIQELT